MNSKNLQEEFPKIYESFFANNPIVVSGCFSLSWVASGSGNSFNHLKIRSKLPLKIYVGLNERKKHGVKIKFISSYNANQKDFEKEKFKNINKQSEEIELFLNNFLEINNHNKGYEINILSEVPRGHGLGLSGSLSSALAAVFFLLVNKIDLDTCNKYETLVKSEEFDNLLRFSLKLVCISKHKYTAGSAGISALINHQSPIFYSPEKIDSQFDIKQLNNIKYKYFDIKKQYGGEDSLSQLPIDYCIIYSGLPSDVKKLSEGTKLNKKRFNKIEDFWKNNLSGMEDLHIYSEKFSKKNSVYKTYDDVNIALSIQLLKNLVDLFEHGDDIGLVDSLINTINGFRHNMALLEGKSTFSGELEYYFKKNAINHNEKIGIMPIYGGKLGGGYVVVLNQLISRNTINQTLNEINGIYPNAYLEYSNWEDGESTQGIKIEQFTSREIYYKDFSASSLILETNCGKKIIGEHQKLIEKIGQGIIIDTINNKILINGEKLTSKQIHSQVTTVEILSTLFLNYSENVHNSDFSISSYSTNKNDMIGKIIVPLKKLTKEYFNKELDIDCSGSITNYNMQLNEKSISIGILKTI